MRVVMVRRLALAVLSLCGLSVSPALAYHNARQPAAVSLPGDAIRLPRDAGSHPAAQTEWWYIVGHLTDGHGHSYGFETTFFRLGGMQKVFPGSTSDTILRTDVAITDETAHRFHMRITNQLPQRGQTIVSTGRLYLHAGTITMSSRDSVHYRTQGTIPAHSQAPGGNKAPNEPGGAVDLALDSLRAPMLVNSGTVNWGKGLSAYYSLTDLRATGTLRIGTRRVTVRGTAWMDHQWGTWDPRSITGWTWMEMQLGDGTDLSLVNEYPGKTPLPKWTMAQLPSGRQQFVPQAQITVLAHWRSPATHILYPARWRVRVPALQLDVVVQPTVADQELVNAYVPSQPMAYWEGHCTIRGTHAGHAVRGDGYTELTGFGASGATVGA